MKRVIVFSMSLFLMVLLTLAFAYIWYNVYGLRIHLPFWRRGNILVVIIYIILLLLFAKMYNALRVGYLKRIDVIISCASV